MKATACMHFQTGYSKFGEGCRNHQVIDICSSEKCSTEKCSKRHQQKYKFFSFQQVSKFGDQCLHKHSVYSDKSDTDILLHEVKPLKATTGILCDKIHGLKKDEKKSNKK